MAHHQHNELQRYHALLQVFSTDTGGSTRELIFAGHFLASAARKTPQAVALETETTIMSYATLFAHALCMSRLLHAKGVTIRDRVVLLVDNSTFFYASYYGAWQIGAIVIPLNIFLQKHEIEHILKDAQPRLMIVADALKGRIEGIEDLPLTVYEHEVTLGDECQDGESLLRRLDLDETAVILYTSGTTGFPKGVMLSSRGIVSNVCQALARFDFIEHERVLCPLPLFHSFTQSTCVWAAIAVGKAVILVSKITRSSLASGIAKRPTVVLGIPGLYGVFCRMHDIDFSSVRYFVCGGEPLTTNIRRFFALRFGRMIANGYGLTEAGPVISADLEDFWKPTHTIGKPLPDITCEIRSPDEQGIGVLWVKGPNLMRGYFSAPEATSSILQDGWLNTGDMARITNDGTLIIGGREKDIIIHKGIKIYPQEIETILATHPDVVLAAVIGVTYDHEEEFPVAYVQLLEGSRATPQELRAHCMRRLATYKVPRKINIEQRLPMTATGKVDKKVLKKREKENV